jgi:hypothetical protein
VTMPVADDCLSAPETTAAEDSLAREFAQIEREHAALRGLVERIAAAAGPGGVTSAVARLMAELVAQLRAHFALEENNGIFNQVERDAPHLAGDVARLRLDHSELLIEASGLAEVARGIRTEDRRRQFEHLFRRFRDRVAVHESDENIVVQRAYVDDVGTKD